MTDVSPQAAATGDASTSANAPASSMRAAKPMMIYVTSEDETDTLTSKLEQVVFKSEKLAIASKFFDTIRMSAGDAEQDRLISKAGKKAPRIIFMNRSYNVSKVLQGRGISAGKLTKAMSALVRKEYKTNFNRMVKGYAKTLNELDRLEARQTQLNSVRARLAEKPNAGKLKKLNRQQKEYTKDREAWQMKHDQLLSFELKAGKVKA